MQCEIERQVERVDSDENKKRERPRGGRSLLVRAEGTRDACTLRFGDAHALLNGHRSATSPAGFRWRRGCRSEPRAGGVARDPRTPSRLVLPPW